MNQLYTKIVDEAMAAQHADVETVKKNRGKKYAVKDGQAYVDAVKGMKVAEGQSKAVIDLHVESVKAHFKHISALTDYVRPEDDPFVEHYQTPVVLEVLYGEDPAFRKSMDVFIGAIGKAEALIGLESARRYAGFYGPTCVVDFALIPGSTSNVVNRILQTVDIPVDHKQAILAAKSWGMNTSYGIGETFAQAVEAGDTLADATKKEVQQFQAIYDHPVKAQVDLMEHAGMTSFDPMKYMEGYGADMTPFVKKAIEEGVHYGNIVTVPAYCVGDVSHHIAQSTYNMCKDDVVMGVIEAVTAVMERSLRASLDKVRSEYQILSLATGSTAAATEYILELDGFNAPMLVDLLTKRFHNFVQLKPTRGAAAELHNCDFMDMIWRGWRMLDAARRKRNGSGDPLVPSVAGFPVDLEPVHESEVIMNPQRYAYPASAITVRCSALMRLADYPCLLTSEPVTATMMTNIIALHPKEIAAPARVCKDCASASMVDFRHEYCQWREAV
ncbi:DUF2193 domain-containing protein [Methanofollis fontis]|uniref:DUF2193 domain-containing protein n=1 Tax=Methanofollis fontis TaxID=2052832 RepID=A0A483CS55_9EURY|nr:DUF2193 domain-containing protein [Methanofollis fontis]TAJ45051.1 DUF2193 domain-containing protein [Methanofollis fontis]